MDGKGFGFYVGPDALIWVGEPSPRFNRLWDDPNSSGAAPRRAGGASFDFAQDRLCPYVSRGELRGLF
jgi:hypothetical protein